MIPPRYLGCDAQYRPSYNAQYRPSCNSHCGPIPQYRPNTNDGFPLVREGVWKYRSINYTIDPLVPEPVRFEVNVDLNFVSQKEGFIFIDNTVNPLSQIDGLAVWKKDGDKDDLYVVQNRPDNGTIIVTPVEFDICGRAIKFSGIFLEAGFDPSNPAQAPAAGQITVTFDRPFN